MLNKFWQTRHSPTLERLFNQYVIYNKNCKKICDYYFRLQIYLTSLVVGSSFGACFFASSKNSILILLSLTIMSFIVGVGSLLFLEIKKLDNLFKQVENDINRDDLEKNTVITVLEELNQLQKEQPSYEVEKIISDIKLAYLNNEGLNLSIIQQIYKLCTKGNRTNIDKKRLTMMNSIFKTEEEMEIGQTSLQKIL